MQNFRKFFVIGFLFVSVAARSQDATIIHSYINTFKELAIEEMQRTGVPASIKLAQGIHETLAGTSPLVLKSNNHFGIKCKPTWTGESVSHDDDASGECFRKYSSAEKSYRDHSDFLKGSERYAFLFSLDPTDYAGWARGLKKAGYATNPKYPQIIIKLIEDYQLQDYTMIALGRKNSTQKDIITAASIPQPDLAGPTLAVKKETETKTLPRQILSYPENEFRINETRVIFVKSGTPFLAIADQYNIPMARLFEFNELATAEIVTQDQLIYLQRKRKTGNNEFHIMTEGETLYDIAQGEAIRLESLLEYNFLQKNMIPATGEKLYLREKAPAAPKLAGKKTVTPDMNLLAYNQGQAKQEKENWILCTVQPKETIYSISKKYNVRIEEIVKWNQLQGYDLRTGQQLKIYQ